MKSKTVTYLRIKVFIEDNSEHLEISIELEDDEDINEAAKILRQKISTLLHLPIEPCQETDDPLY